MKLPNKEYPYELIHTKCGKVAYYSKRIPESTESIHNAPDILINIDGSKVFLGDSPRCVSCGEEFIPGLESYFKKAE